MPTASSRLPGRRGPHATGRGSLQVTGNRDREGQTSRFLQLEAAYSQAPEVTAGACTWIRSRASVARAQVFDRLEGGRQLGRQHVLPCRLDKLLEKATRAGDGNSAVVSGRDDGSSASAQGKEPDSVTVEARGRGDR